MQDVARERVAAVVIENINKALSFDKETRINAEKTLKTLEISQGFQLTFFATLIYFIQRLCKILYSDKQFY